MDNKTKINNYEEERRIRSEKAKESKRRLKRNDTIVQLASASALALSHNISDAAKELNSIIPGLSGLMCTEGTRGAREQLMSHLRCCLIYLRSAMFTIENKERQLKTEPLFSPEPEQAATGNTDEHGDESNSKMPTVETNNTEKQLRQKWEELASQNVRVGAAFDTLYATFARLFPDKRNKSLHRAKRALSDAKDIYRQALNDLQKAATILDEKMLQNTTNENKGQDEKENTGTQQDIEQYGRIYSVPDMEQNGETRPEHTRRLQDDPKHIP